MPGVITRMPYFLASKQGNASNVRKGYYNVVCDSLVKLRIRIEDNASLTISVVNVLYKMDKTRDTQTTVKGLGTNQFGIDTCGGTNLL